MLKHLVGFLLVCALVKASTDYGTISLAAGAHSQIYVQVSNLHHLLGCSLSNALLDSSAGRGCSA